jgi:hypothetical protein
MDWKQFLKPDWRKVILFLVIKFVFPLMFLYICVFVRLLLNMIISVTGDSESFCFFINQIIFEPFSYLLLNLDLYYLQIFLDILWWIPSCYLPACFIVWIYDKYKKKTNHPSPSTIITKEVVET